MRVGGIELGKSPRVAGVIVGNIEDKAVTRALDVGTDLLELRCDTFAERSLGALKDGVNRLRKRKVPLILTVRSPKEGGAHDLIDSERLAIFEALIPLVDCVDIELGSGKILKKVLAAARRHRKKRIVSYHNFKTTPVRATLEKTIQRARDSGADIVKIATTAKGVREMKRLAALLIDSNDLIVIAMGKYGTASRVFFPALGSLITYGSITGSTAPGQLPVRDIKKQFAFLGLT